MHAGGPNWYPGTGALAVSWRWARPQRVRQSPLISCGLLTSVPSRPAWEDTRVSVPGSTGALVTHRGGAMILRCSSDLTHTLVQLQPPPLARPTYLRLHCLATSAELSNTSPLEKAFVYTGCIDFFKGISKLAFPPVAGMSGPPW